MFINQECTYQCKLSTRVIKSKYSKPLGCIM